MAVINCKNCGGSIDLSEDKTFGTCDFCGSTMTFPKLDDDQRAAAFNRGNHFRRIGEFDKALAVYERIVQENDQDAEAHWCCALCRFGIEYVEDPETFEWLPTCHRASFDSFLEDVDYLAAVEHSEGLTQRQYRKDAAKIAEVQRGILASSQNTEPYDVFICYKESDAEGQRTRDSLMAQDIYYQLTEQGKRVFFARITLEDVAGTQYEPYIFAALNSAKVMVVVGTKPEHFSAVWVKNEWSRFLAMMRKDRSKLLLPCYAGMDPYDLPEQLSVLQSYDMTRIGFIQDLIRGIGKVVETEKKPEPVPTAAPAAPVQVAPVQAAPQQSNNIIALLKRGAMALEDSDWTRADEFYEEVLNQDAECGEAYLGKFLAQQRCSTLEAVAQGRIDMPRKIDTEKSSVKPDLTGVEEFAQAHTVYGFLTKEQILKGFPSAMNITLTAPGWRKILAEEPTWWTGNKVLARAEKYGAPELKAQIAAAKEAALEGLRGKLAQAEEQDWNTEKKAQKLLEEKTAKARCDAEEAYKENRASWEARLRELSRLMDEAESMHRLDFLERSLLLLGNDPAVQDVIQNCKDRKQELIDQEKARKEADEKAREEATRQQKKKKKLATMVIAAAAVIAVTTWLLTTYLFIPIGHYSKAEKLLEQEQFDEAKMIFLALDDYRDSADRAKECDYLHAEQLLEQGKPLDAAHLFATLYGYQDSENRSNELYYSVAETLLTQGQFDEAKKVFLTAKGYKDSADRAKECDYRHAEKLLDQEQFDEAKKIFLTLKDYNNSTDRANECDYLHAEKLMKQGKTATAAMYYHKAGIYSGAHERSKELWEEIAVRDTISASFHALGLRANGTVMASGDNDNGHCNVQGWTNIVAISAGGCSLGLRADGTVIAAGHNSDGRGDVQGWTDIVAISAGTAHSLGLRADGTVVATGSNYDGECDVQGWTDIVAISAGTSYSLGLRADGTVVATGHNHRGQCYVERWTDIVAISAGTGHSLGLRADGTVVATGNNDDGQCTVESWTNIVAIAAGTSYSLGLRADGTVVAVGSNTNGQCNVKKWTNIVAIAAGSSSSLGLRADGTVVLAGPVYYNKIDVGGWKDLRLPH